MADPDYGVLPSSRLKVVTVVGTRPEIIRLAPTIRRLDAVADHILVHTGQNYDYELNEIFFDDLGIRRPDYFLEADTSSLGAVLGSVITRTETVLRAENPDAFLVLGDTNSSISAIIAKRMKIPVFHMEAGNRCFDENVPEETNRRLVDHISDYNLVYTEHARRNLLAEGVHPSQILLTGSPMGEVLDGSREGFAASTVLSRLDLSPGNYFLASIHREENVDDPARLTSLLVALTDLHRHYRLPVVVSTHPRTRKRLEQLPTVDTDGLLFHPPFGFHDYIRLQIDARAVLSDSGTISEESAILGFRAVTLRDAIERPEAQDAGSIIVTGVESSSILNAVRIALDSEVAEPPSEYRVLNTSQRVVSFIHSAAPSHSQRRGIRRAASAGSV